MPEWDPEVVVDEELARTLIADQFPDVVVSRLRLLAEGWDNTVWLVDDDLVFRFPRRGVAIPGVEREIAILPSLAMQLPAAIPEPAFIGRPTDAFAWPFFGSRLVPGRELADAAPTDATRSLLAPELGRFLRALHGPAVLDAFADRLPVDPNRRADMTLRVPMTRERLVALERRGLWRSRPLPWLAAAESLPPSPAGAVTHGDLHVRHVLLNDEGSLAGVIDWGDLSRSDPAIDLPLYWSLLPPDARQAFLDAYGRPGEAALLRARVLAVFLSATVALYGDAEGLAALKHESLAGLERAVAD
ncbi:MAG TPA: phosphotransferase [Candidatus Limnocylindria bacterium]|nr:phosphotransferase [Candidatus Limnocylindria bacterium]